MKILVAFAHEKICPMVRVVTKKASPFPTEGDECLGDKCMAWRWAYEKPKIGFCGLAGKLGEVEGK